MNSENEKTVYLIVFLLAIVLISGIVVKSININHNDSNSTYSANILK